MFIDSQGNLCPCDFTMLSFGNILEQPVKEIWKKINKKFRVPGNICYANKSNDCIAEKKGRHWPLKIEDSYEVLEQYPSYDPDKIPVFNQKMGMDVKKI